MRWQDIPAEALAAFRAGTVIPAHPLALDAERRLDERRQRALTRYYIDAGAGGLAVGVHTTQFAIRDVGLYRPVLELAAETARAWTTRPLFLVAGVAGRSAQAVAEARVARDLGYHAVLVSLAAFRDASEDDDARPLPRPRRRAARGRLLPAARGRRRRPLARVLGAASRAIENVVGIKVAPFDRYRTLDVVHGVAAAGAQERISLYTGNDDHIVLDLTVPFRTRGGRAALRRRPARPLVGLDADGRRDPRALPRRARPRRRPRRPAGARQRRHGLQRRVLRRRERVPRRDRGLPRGAAPAGPARGPLVPRPGGGSEPGPGRGDRPRLPAATRSSPTTRSWPRTSSAGWEAVA